MKQTYYITPTLTIVSDDEGNFDAYSLFKALAVIGGWTIGEETPLGDTLISRALPNGERETRFIPLKVDGESVERHARTYGLNPLVPMQSNEFAQMLMTMFPCVPTAIPSRGGALCGLWHVESLTGWQGADIQRTGVRYGHNEYIETYSLSLPEAICLNVLSRVGIGKRAYLYYPDMSVENGELVYMGEKTIQTIKADPEFILHLVAAPDLDAWAMLGAPEDVLEDARALADAQAVIQKVELRKIQEARQQAQEQEEKRAAELAGEAVAPAEPAPEV